MPSSLPTLVFIHGAQSNHKVWATQQSFFTQHGYPVLCLDLPGHGSDNRPLLNSIEDMAISVEQQLIQKDIINCCLIGHSMGSLIALALCTSRLISVQQLFLIGTAAPMTVNHKLLDLAKNDPNSAIEKMVTWSHTDSSKHIDTRTTMLDVLSTNGPEVLWNDLNACNNYSDALHQATQYQARAHIIMGANDVMTAPANLTPLKEAFQNLSYHELPNTGHSVMSEASTSVNTIILGALSH